MELNYSDKEIRHRRQDGKPCEPVPYDEIDFTITDDCLYTLKMRNPMNPWAILRPKQAAEYKDYDTLDGNVGTFQKSCVQVYKQSIQDGDEPSSVKISIPGVPEPFEQFYIEEQSEDTSRICLIYPFNYDSMESVLMVNDAILEQKPLNNQLKKVTFQCLIKRDERDSMKEDYFRNICPKF